MMCEDVRRREVLTDYLGGDLIPDVVADLERHLETCPPCLAHVNLYKTITCRELLQECLADYLDGVLSADVLADLERHLEICPPCVAYINTYKKARALVGRAAHVEMPEEMKAILRAFLGESLPREGS